MVTGLYKFPATFAADTKGTSLNGIKATEAWELRALPWNSDSQDRQTEPMHENRITVNKRIWGAGLAAVLLIGIVYLVFENLAGPDVHLPQHPVSGL